MRIVQPAAVLEVGGPRSPRLPANAEAPLYIRAGIDTVVGMLCYRSNGEPFPIVGGSAILTVKRTPESDKLIQIAHTRDASRGPNYIEFAFGHNATKNMADGGRNRYVYDIVFVADNGDRDILRPISPFRVRAGVSRP